MTTFDPCPWCGGKAALVKRDVEPQGDPWYGGRVESFVLCECGACLFDGYFHEGFSSPERAIAAWNTRALPPSPGQEQAADPLADLVARFSEALLSKLRAAQRKYGYDGWVRDDWADELRLHLRQHVEKGDPRDVAAYCAFAWHHGWSLAQPAPSPATPEGCELHAEGEKS